MPSPFWQAQTAPLYGAARTIGSGIASLPMMRAMAANRAAQGQFYQAHAAQEMGAADLERQKAAAMANETQEGSDFADSAASAVPVFSDPSATPDDRRAAATDLMRKAGKLAAKDPDKAMQIFDHLVQRMQASPTDQVQQFEANNPGKLVTGADVLSDPQLAAAQSAKGAPAVNSASTAQIAANLPANAIKSVEQSEPIPNNPATSGMTPKPFPLTISQAIQSKLQNTFTQLVQSGVPPAQAEIQAKGLVMGTNATAQPTITTNNPGSPEVRTPGRLWGTNVTPAVPPTLSTNSFHVAPGGADQTIVSALMQNPKTAAVIQQLGLDQGGAAPQTQTAQAGPDAGAMPATTTGTPKQLDPETARQILQQAGGDKNKARQMATQAGYTF
jgi:hypothetical protein